MASNALNQTQFSECLIRVMTLITTLFVTYEFNEDHYFHVAIKQDIHFEGRAQDTGIPHGGWGTLSPVETKCLSFVQSLDRMFFIWANFKSPHPYNVHRETHFGILSKLCKFTITAGSWFSSGGWRGKPTRTLALQSMTFRNVTSCYIKWHYFILKAFITTWKYIYEIFILFTRLSV